MAFGKKKAAMFKKGNKAGAKKGKPLFGGKKATPFKRGGGRERKK